MIQTFAFAALVIPYLYLRIALAGIALALGGAARVVANSYF